ncbi:MAG: ABC transporter ATP-binding protein [Chloroflexota bacterium]|nr:ABC transporter ATP-binding protein [Chloroflexota bacterium]
MSTSPVVLETRDLSRHFGGLKAVEGVDLQIHESHLHSIIGPNGAGKTTLFNLLSGALKPTRGKVLLRGQDITGLPPHRTAHLGMGRSYQVTNIFPTLSVFENVRLAAQALGDDNLKAWTLATRFDGYEEQAHAALQATGLTSVAMLPALGLAHGDKRRLELAMLLAQNLEIWLLDEPTAGLASEHVPEFMELVRQVQQEGQKTVVLVEHNMNVVMSLSDRISVMHHGQLLAEGTPAEIATDPTVQKAYLGELYGDFEGMKATP